MPRRFRINGPLLLGFFFVVTGIGLYVSFPLLRATPPTDTAGAIPPMLEIMRERTITCMTGLWFFVFGATIGSFLNVVAYRMPMGLSFVAKPSRCPYCETPILFRHNVPIFGWLALRGRCHACRLPISMRYPLVEVIVGVLFFLLFAQELASGGANLPVEFSQTRPGIMWNVLTPNWGLVGLYFFHAFLVGVLATIALMKFDRLRIPARLVVFTIVVAVVLRYRFESLTVLEWWSPFSPPSNLPSIWKPQLGLGLGLGLDLLIGSLVGWAMHCVIESQQPHRRQSSSYSGSIAIGATVGSCLGWQILVPVTMLTTMAQFFTTIIANLLRRPSDMLWATSYLWATTTAICLWKHLPALGLPSADSLPLTHWVWLVISLIATFVTARLSSPRHGFGDRS